MAGTNPRAARIAALIQRVVASSIERELHDKRLASITVTEVRVTNDLQIAKVYWTQLGHEGHEEGERKRAQQALDQAKGHLRSLVGHKAGLRLTPQLQFVFDEVPGEAHEIEDILAVAKKRDEELARARATAQYAGDADPYKHDDETEEAVEEELDEQEHENKDEYTEYPGDVVEVEEFEDFDNSGDDLEHSDDDPVDPVATDPASTIDTVDDHDEDK
jgi:ribosome-binding factor A